MMVSHYCFQMQHSDFLVASRAKSISDYPPAFQRTFHIRLHSCQCSGVWPSLPADCLVQ